MEILEAFDRSFLNSLYHYRMLNKRIKDKHEDIERLSKELDTDAKKKVELEDQVERMSGEIETYKTSIDDFNKRYYELKKQRDALHSDRKYVYIGCISAAVNYTISQYHINEFC